MSLITDPVLNIYQSHAQVLLDKFNLANSLNLTLDDFTVGNPSIYIPSAPGAKENTKVVFTPLASASYYNNFSIYYARMDVAAILGNLAVSVPRETATTLVELLPSINELFGINLLAEDIIDQSLPAVDPMDPTAPVDVMVQTRNTSLMFYGSYTLTLNRLAVTPSPFDPEPADLFLVLHQPGDTVFQNTVRVVNSSGDPVPEFSFMRNALTVTRVSIDNQILLKNNHVAFLGEFEFNILVGGNNTAITTTCIVLTPQGTIARAAADATDDFGFTNDDEIKYFNRPGSDYVYALSQGEIKRFAQDGTETVFATPAFEFEPAFLQVDLDGKLYVVSPVYDALVDTDNNPNTSPVLLKQSTVIRLLSNGAVDNLFDPIVIRQTGLAQPWAIGSLALIETMSSGAPSVLEADGFYLGLIPLTVPSSLDDCPIINNVPVVPNGTVLEYGYLPVFRFLQSGIRDNTFVSNQTRVKPASVYEPTDSRLVAGKSALAVQGKDVVFFTNKQNPLTGYLHHMPVRYSDVGKLMPIGGDYYFAAYRWLDAEGIVKLKNGDMLVFGRGRVVLPDGNFSTDDRNILVSYNASSVPDSVLYQTTQVGGFDVSINAMLVVQN